VNIKTFPAVKGDSFLTAAAQPFDPDIEGIFVDTENSHNPYGLALWANTNHENERGQQNGFQNSANGIKRRKGGKLRATTADERRKYA